mgnify:CR=1 FL=1
MKKTEVIIKTGSGAELTISGDSEFIRGVVSDIYRREDSRLRFRNEFLRRKIVDEKSFLSKNKDLSKSDYRKIVKNKTKSKTDIITELLNDSFFNESRTIKQIHDAFRQKAHSCNITSLPAILLPLVRKNIISRNKNNEGLWVYRNPRVKSK